MKETPCRLVLFQQPMVRFFQLDASLFVGVGAGLVLAPRFVGHPAGRLHQALRNQCLGKGHINFTPGAARLAWRKADGIADLVDRLADAVNPAKAEGLFNRLGPGDARLAGVLLVEADQQCLL